MSNETSKSFSTIAAGSRLESLSAHEAQADRLDGGVSEAYELSVRSSSAAMDPLSLEVPTESPIDAKKRAQVQVAAFTALSWAMFMEGWNDGTNGPLLPAMQRHYHIGFAVVSLIFITNCVGFVSAAFSNIRMSEKLGFGKTIVIGAVTQAIGYAIQAPAPPFPVFAIAPFFSGFGISLQAAGVMTYAAKYDKNPHIKLGIVLAAYGVGALLSPLSATAFSTTNHWSFHYLVSLGGTVLSIVLLTVVFRFQDLNAALKSAGQTVREQSTSRENLYRQMFKLKATHLLALFALAYVGAEVTLGSWIVTFVIDERHGGRSSGYITSGFFGGLTLGRIVLLWVNKRIGERRVIWVYVVLCTILEITIWVVPSLIGNAIAVSFIGLLLGPIYPIIITTAERLVPHWLMVGAVGWIGAVGQAGSAIVPFVTGTLSSKFGVISLQPLIISVFCVMLILWAAVPKDIRRFE